MPLWFSMCSPAEFGATLEFINLISNMDVLMNLEDVLKYGHNTVLKSIDGLDADAAVVEGVCGWWSTRHIMAHLASHELVLGDVLDQLLGATNNTPHLANYLKNGLAFNDLEVDARDGMSYADLVNEYNAASERARALAARVPVELRRKTGTLPWYGEEYDLEDLVAYSNYGHKREHCAQIAVYRDTLK